MVLYTTVEDVKQMLGVNSDNLLAEIDDKALTHIIEEQSRIIDDMISVVENVPYDDIFSPDTNPVPKIVKSLTETFVQNYLWSRSAFKDIPDYVQKKYDNAIKLIEKIQKGTISIGTPSTITQPDTGGANESFRWTSKPKVFTTDL